MLYLTVLTPLLAHFLPTEDKRIKVAVAIAPAIFVILFRFGLGADYFSYQYLYNNHDVSSLYNAINSQVNSMELGFRILIYLFKSFQLPFQVFIAAVSLTIYAFFLKWIEDSELDFSLSVMLLNGMFFIVWSMGALRQGLVLAVGTYLFFNKKVNLSTLKSIIIIIILGQFHASAYIYFFFIIAKKFDYSLKTLLPIIIISLVFTGIPYYKILLPFDQFRVVRKFIGYASGASGFWDFSGLVRIAFVIFIIVFYRYFKKDPYVKQLADMSLIGFSFYFFLKSSELVASRINIFTFVLMIPLFVYLTMEFFEIKILYALAIIGTSTFSMAYLQKDLMAIQRQVGYENQGQIYRFRMFFQVDNDDYYNYDNLYASLHFNRGYCMDTISMTHPKLRPASKQGYMVLRDRYTGNFGLINDQGSWHINPIFSVEPTLYGNILAFEDVLIDVEKTKRFNKDNELDLNVLQDNKDDLSDDGEDSDEDDYDDELIFYPPPYYYNIDSNNSENKFITLAHYRQLEKSIEEDAFAETSIEAENYFKDLSVFFSNLDEVKDAKILTYKQPFEYNVLNVKYYRNNYYFHLNDDLKLHNGMVFTKMFRFDHNNMALARGFCGNFILNSDGKVVTR